MEDPRVLEVLDKILDKFTLEEFRLNSTRVLARVDRGPVRVSFSYGRARSNKYFFKLWLIVRGKETEFQVNNPLLKFGKWKKELRVWEKLVAIENFLLEQYADRN